MRKLVCFIYRHCDRILIQSPAFSPLIESQGVSPERIEKQELTEAAAAAGAAAGAIAAKEAAT